MIGLAKNSTLPDPCARAAGGAEWPAAATNAWGWADETGLKPLGLAETVVPRSRTEQASAPKTWPKTWWFGT